MATKRKRREAARRERERELLLLEQQAGARRRRIRVAAVSLTAVVLVVAVVTVAAVALSGNDKATVADASAMPSPSATSPSATSPSATPAQAVAKGPSVSFRGVTVKGAADLGGAPTVTSASSSDPTKLEYKDLVVGKGKPATPTSQVSVQYVGALYKNGKVFDSSWANGAPADFSLTGVVPGFTQGIGGTSGVPPMKVGGRRVIIMPAPLGYGAQASGSIPANSPLVFVVDLKNVT